MLLFFVATYWFLNCLSALQFVIAEVNVTLQSKLMMTVQAWKVQTYFNFVPDQGGDVTYRLYM